MAPRGVILAAAGGGVLLFLFFLLPSLTSSRASERKVALLDRPAEVGAKAVEPVELVAAEPIEKPVQASEGAPAAPPERSVSEKLAAWTASQGTQDEVQGPKLKRQKGAKARAHEVAPKAQRDERKKRHGGELPSGERPGKGKSAIRQEGTAGSRLPDHGKRLAPNVQKHRFKQGR